MTGILTGVRVRVIYRGGVTTDRGRVGSGSLRTGLYYAITYTIHSTHHTTALQEIQID